MVKEDKYEISLVGAKANQLVFKPAFVSEELTEQFFIYPNVKGENGSKDIIYADYKDGILKRYEGCGFNPTPFDPLAKKTIYCKNLRGDKEFCHEDWNDMFEGELFKYDESDWTDMRGTVISNIVLDIYKFGIIEDVKRLAYFGDENSTNPKFDMVDGLFTKIYPAAVTAGTLPFVQIPSTLNSGDGLALLNALYEKQTKVLRAVSKTRKVYNVSSDVFLQIENDYENAGTTGLGISKDAAGNYSYRGIPVKEQGNWDVWSIEAGLTENNFAELTTVFNKILITKSMSPNNKFDMWYDKKDEKMYLKARPTIGFDIFHTEFAVWAKG